MEEHTDLFGIPVPSTDKVFLSFVVIHIVISIVAVISGVFAMFTEKTAASHKRRGTVYFWAMIFSFVTIVILSVMRWPHNIHLLTIGTLAIGSVLAGRNAARKHRGNWTRVHTACMGMSYVFLLTGFYVDNGKNLPFWRMFPQWVFYIFPAFFGIPLIIRALVRHPLNRDARMFKSRREKD